MHYPHSTYHSGNSDSTLSQSILPAGAVESCYGFDTGPDNLFIDSAVLCFTKDKQEHAMDGVIGRTARWTKAHLMSFYTIHTPCMASSRRRQEEDLSVAAQQKTLAREIMSKDACPEDCVAAVVRITTRSLVKRHRRYGLSD